MKLLFILTLTALFCISCGAKKSSPVYGKTTYQELLAQKGNPESEEEMTLADSKMLKFSDGVSYQVTKNVVISSYDNPKKEKATLVYWQHQFKDCDIQIEKIQKKLRGHDRAGLFMRCNEQGRGVIYRDGADFVFSVVEYEKQ